jgi:hypothetical protein
MTHQEITVQVLGIKTCEYGPTCHKFPTCGILDEEVDLGRVDIPSSMPSRDVTNYLFAQLHSFLTFEDCVDIDNPLQGQPVEVSLYEGAITWKRLD